MTRDAFRKAFGQYSETEFADIVAEQAANAMQIEMCDTALLAIRAALKQQSTSYYTEASLGSISTSTLVNSLAKMGDRADRVVCWVMHSKPYYDLVASQINANITGVSNFAVRRHPDHAEPPGAGDRLGLAGDADQLARREQLLHARVWSTAR
jgi:lambda repressor-like predicted transcriptional regulator